jgi:hypothetical protein
MYPSQRFYEATNKATQLIVLAYQALALLVFVAGLYLSYAWLSNPFMGGFFEHTFILNGTQTREVGQQWSLYERGFEGGDQLRSVNGTPIKNANDLKNILDDSVVAQEVAVEMHAQDGTTKSATVKLESFSATDRIAFHPANGFESGVSPGECVDFWAASHRTRWAGIYGIYLIAGNHHWRTL